MAERITFDDKISLTTSQLPRVNKCTDTDLNEIKNVVNSHAEDIETIQQDIETIHQDIETIQQDSGWLQATLTNQFKAYHDIDGNIPRYRKVGKTVEIRGVLAPTSTIAASNDETIAFTLPSGFRPSGTQRDYICQGSGRNVWLLTVFPEGDVGVSRYGTTANSDIPTSAWMPFNAVFMID